MRVLLVINLLVVISVLLSESAFIGDPSDLNQELFLYNNQVRIVYQLLAEECPEEVKLKRSMSNSNIPFADLDLKVQKIHYNALLKKLNECTQKRKKSQLTKAQTVTAKSTTTASPTTTQTEVPPKPAQCLSATNLTESWRMEHSGKDIKGGGPNNSGGYACGLRRDLQWFRFTGEAGTQMLNKCPKKYSCGSVVAMWTDAAMPTAIGVPTNITVYGSVSYDYSTECKDYTVQVEVMRCSMSTDHDFIYRYTGISSAFNTAYPASCSVAFCGMM